MRRLLVLLAFAAAPVAVAQTAAPAGAAVSSDTLAARAARAEAFFFDGKTADLRALADSAMAAAMTDEMHQTILGQLLGLGGASATGEWTTTEIQGLMAYRRAYTVGPVSAVFVVVFNAEGRIAGLSIQPAEG